VLHLDSSGQINADRLSFYKSKPSDLKVALKEHRPLVSSPVKAKVLLIMRG